MRITKEKLVFACSLGLMLLTIPLVMRSFRTTSEVEDFSFKPLPPPDETRYGFSFPDPLLKKSWLDVPRSPFTQVTEKKPMPMLKISPPPAPEPALPLPPTIPPLPLHLVSEALRPSTGDVDAILPLVSSELNATLPDEQASPDEKKVPPGATDVDTINMKDGRKFTGRIVYEDSEKVEVALDRAKITLYQNEIASIERRKTALDIYRERKTKSAPRNHTEALELAKWCFEYDLPDQAIEEAQSAISLKPDFVPAYLLLGDIYHRERRTDEELTLYGKALDSKAGQLEEIHARMGKLYEMLGLLDRALESYESALSLYPDFLDGTIGLARVSTRLGRFDSARKTYEDLLARASTDARVLTGASELFLVSARDAADFRNARDRATNALILQPDSAEALELLALAEFATGDLKESASNLKKTINANPWKGSAYSNLGVLLLILGKDEEALEAFRQAIERDPSLVVPHLGLGFIAARAGDYPGAALEFLNAAEMEPRSAYTHLGLACCHIREGNTSDAAAQFREAAETDSRPADQVVRTSAIAGLTYVYLIEGKPLDAARLSHEAFAEKEHDPNTLALGAIALLRGGDADAALRFLDRAGAPATRTPAPPLVRNALACALYMKGNHQKAMDVLRSVAKEFPEDAYASKTIAEIEENLSKLLWEDDFQRPDSKLLGGQWVETEEFGVFAEVKNKRLLLSGQQTRFDWGRTVVERTVPAPAFACYAAQFAPPENEIEFGVSLSVIYRIDAQYGGGEREGPTLFLGFKSVPPSSGAPEQPPLFRLCYLWKDREGETEDPKFLDVALPAGEFELSIDRPDPKKGQIRLLIGVPGKHAGSAFETKEVATLDVKELETSELLKLGIYTSAKRNHPVRLIVSRTQVVERKAE